MEKRRNPPSVALTIWIHLAENVETQVCGLLFDAEYTIPNNRSTLQKQEHTQEPLCRWSLKDTSLKGEKKGDIGQQVGSCPYRIIPALSERRPSQLAPNSFRPSTVRVSESPSKAQSPMIKICDLRGQILFFTSRVAGSICFATINRKW